LLRRDVADTFPPQEYIVMSTRLIAAAMALSLAAAPAAMAQTKEDTGPVVGPSIAALAPVSGSGFTALLGLLAFAGVFGAGVIATRKRA